MEELTIGSVFSGIGGLEKGLEDAIDGAETVYQVEKDPYCYALLERLWPHTEKHRDIVGLTHVPRVGILCGGFPCQDISAPGAGIGIHGSRSRLWFEQARLIEQGRPKYVVLENVPRLLRAGFGSVLCDLARLGYDAEWTCISAATVGAPHLRSRLFVLAYPEGHGRPGMGTGANLGEFGQWWQYDSAHLRAFLDAPFERHHSWPQPLIRGTDDGVRRRMDRLRAVGNAVVPDVASVVGRHIAYMEGII